MACTSSQDSFLNLSEFQREPRFLLFYVGSHNQEFLVSTIGIIALWLHSANTVYWKCPNEWYLHWTINSEKEADSESWSGHTEKHIKDGF